ncbi:DUF599 family protein [Glycocaulis profundi]|nr:DUF599 family protein [Glycocaulis profundi]
MMEYAGLIGFVAMVAAYSLLVDHSPLAARTLSAKMTAHRMAWFQRAAAREVRIMDSQILAGLQNGVAFFGSTSLLGVGAAFTLLTRLDDLITLMADLPVAEPSRQVTEIMVVGLLAIYAYAVFKFGWAYRLLNYCAMLLGAVPDCTQPEAARAAARKAAKMNAAAGKQFNRGLRALFLSLGYLGWIGGPVVQLGITALIIAILTYRQFFSPALHALDDEISPPAA